MNFKAFFRIFIDKFLSALLSTVPVFLVVEVLNLFRIFPISFDENILFLVASFFLVVGMAIFSLGVERSINKIGQYIGSSVVAQKNIFLLIIICFLIGVFSTFAEPDLAVLSFQLSITKVYLFIFLIGVGVGFFLVIGVLRIFLKQNLKIWLFVFYALIFAIINLVDKSFIPVIFDSGGMTTGPITIPFILSLGISIAKSMGDGGGNDSFGLSAFSSLGPLLILPIFTSLIKFNSSGTGDTMLQSITDKIVFNLSRSFANVIFSIIPIIFLFFIYNFIFLKLPFKNILKIIVGIIYVYFGLSFFLAGVDIGFVPIAKKMGYIIATKSITLLFFVSGIIGFVITLCEPSVKILTNQIDQISNGAIKKTNILLFLSISIALAVVLSILRIIFDFSVLYYIIPGYIIALALSFFTPDIYFGIAFDSGGVASGSLSSAFILPFAIGIANYFCQERNIVGEEAKRFVLSNSFGIISSIALMPLIVIQIFGLAIYVMNNYNNIVNFRKINKGEDNQIIHFD